MARSSAAAKPKLSVEMTGRAAVASPTASADSRSPCLPDSTPSTDGARWSGLCVPLATAYSDSPRRSGGWVAPPASMSAGGSGAAVAGVGAGAILVPWSLNEGGMEPCCTM